MQSVRSMRRVHYAWIVVVVTFFSLLASAGVRTAPSIIIVPLETEFGWDRASVSLAVAVSLFAFGFGAPLGGIVVDRFGPRRVMLGGLTLITLGLIPLLFLTDLWQLHLFWGLVVGIGTGGVSGTLGAVVAARWFNKHRGMIVGLLGAAAAAGQLIFFPGLIALGSAAGWRSVIVALIIGCAVALVIGLLFMRNRPEDVGAQPIGEVCAAMARSDDRSTPLREALRSRDFWLLAGSFFICGYTTNGLIGTHLLPHTLEHGFVEAEMAGAIGIMGAMNVFGTLVSGWLSERFDNRKLLAIYYGFRAVSLAALPFILEMPGMLLFSIIYGLDWVATVPPTVNITAQRFGRKSLGTMYGWIFCAHMIGAGIASYAGGFFRDMLGDYHLIFVSAAVLGLVAAGLSMSLPSTRRLALKAG